MRLLPTTAVVAVVLVVVDLIIQIVGSGIGLPFSLTTLAVLLLCVGILAK